jgi:hypothetical protein
MDPQNHKECSANVFARINTSALVLVAAVGLAAGITPRVARAAVPNPTVTGPITAVCSPNCPSPPGPVNGIHVPDPFDGAGNLQEFIDTRAACSSGGRPTPRSSTVLWWSSGST